MNSRGRHGHSQPYLPLLQLRREEFSMLPYPADADLFQLLWCPYVHFEGPPNEPPGFLAFWRREADIADPLLVEPPKPDGIELFECRFNAEYITEYPVSASFEAHFREDLDQWHEDATSVCLRRPHSFPGWWRCGCLGRPSCSCPSRTCRCR